MNNLNFVLKEVQKQTKLQPKNKLNVATITPSEEKESKRKQKSRKAVKIPADLESENDETLSNVSGPISSIPAPKLPIQHTVNFICNDIDAAVTMDPFTHIYMYDLGFPPELQQSIARKFNGSVHARYLVSYRPPRRVIDEYGYLVRHIYSLNTSMFGSGENHMAYFYERLMDEESLSTVTNVSKSNVKITLSAREGLHGIDETDVEVDCDPAFAAAVTLATGPLEDLADHVQKIMTAYINQGRSRRERKPHVVHNV